MGTDFYHRQLVVFRIAKIKVTIVTLITEALLGVNSDKRHGLEPATWEPRTGDDRQTIATN